MKELFGEALPTPVRDPFKKECIKAIHLHVIEGFFSDRFHITGSVEFKNDKTEGKQNFEADSLGDLYIQIQNFCLTL